MKGRIEYILKHSNLLQFLYKNVVGFLFRFVGIFIRTDENLALFSSYSGKRFDDSPRFIFELMKQRDDCSSIKMVWAFNNPEEIDVVGAEKVKMDSPRYFFVALKAKYWITNVNIERGLRFKKKETVYLNTWHGTPIKTIGNAVSGRSDYDFSHVNLISSDGPYFSQRMIKDFNANPDAILSCGRPCDDALFNKDYDSKQREAREKIGVAEGKFVILYAPTWRDSTDGGSSYAFAPPINFLTWKKRLGEDVVILFRAHSITNKVLGLAFDDQILDVSDYRDVNDLILASDVLISDYSGIYFDYAITGKPMISFCYDYDEYSNIRGMYFDVREYLTSFSDEDGLLSYLVSSDLIEDREKTRIFFETFSGFGGNATAECVDAVLRLGAAK